jgi:hypothetical protein
MPAEDRIVHRGIASILLIAAGAVVGWYAHAPDTVIRETYVVPDMVIGAQALPPGHPPIPGYAIAPALPEGHPPVAGFAAPLTMPRAHPECPGSGVFTAPDDGEFFVAPRRRSEPIGI